jgi:uncharacterized Tic20 family protein
MSEVAANQTPPTRMWYFLPLFFVLLGPVFAVYLLYQAFTAPIHTIAFSVPGSSKIYVMKPGEYSLWVDTRNINLSDKMLNDLETAKIEIVQLKTQTSVILYPKVTWRDKRLPLAHFSLGNVSFDQPGYYQINATGQFLTPYKVYLRQPSLFRILRSLAWAIFLTLLSLLAALLSTIILLIQRTFMRNPMETKEPKTSTNLRETPPPQAITWAMICHLSGFAGLVFPFGNIIAPLIIWGIKREEFPYLDDQGKEAINFQISVTIYYLIAAVLILIIIGLFLLPLLAAFQVIAMIIASIESAHGKLFRYPLTIRFLR